MFKFNKNLSIVWLLYQNKKAKRKGFKNMANNEINNDFFKEELKKTVNDYLIKIKRIKEYNVDAVTNYLDKIKTLDNILHNGKNNSPIDYVLHYFEKIPKPDLA